MGTMRDSTDEADGGLCWNASLVLAEYLATSQRHLEGTTVSDQTCMYGSLPVLVNSVPALQS